MPFDPKFVISAIYLGQCCLSHHNDAIAKRLPVPSEQPLTIDVTPARQARFWPAASNPLSRAINAHCASAARREGS
jgi:hypothetical protein